MVVILVDKNLKMAIIRNLKKEFVVKTKYKLACALSCVAATMILTGCSNGKGNNTSYDAPAIIKAKQNAVSLAVVEANSGAPLSGVNLQLIGPATDIEGNSVSTLTSSETGIAMFYTEEGKTVRILASKQGYVNTGKEVTVAKGVNQIALPMLKFEENASVAGITMKQETVTSTQGTVDKNITVVVKEDKNTTTPLTVITIPKGTVLETEDGKKVTGKVTVEAVHYDDNATQLFPGGLVALAEDVPADANGSGERSTQEVNFISAGFTSIQMKDDSGQSVKHFVDQNITIAMTLPHTTVNPETGKLVKANDKIPIWSYNELTGKWKYEDMGNVVPNPNDNNATWAVIYTASHLSYWNLDWHYGAVCKPGHIEITDQPQGTDVVTSLVINGQGFSKTVFDYNGDGFYDLDNIPKYKSLNFSLMYDGNVVDSKTNVVLGDKSCKLDMKTGNIKPKTPVTVKVVEECRDGSHQRPLPSVPGYVMSGGAWTYINSTNTDGELTLKLDPGAPKGTTIYAYLYTADGRYENSYVYKTIPKDVTEDQTIKFILSKKYDPYCFPVTGAATGAAE